MDEMEVDRNVDDEARLAGECFRVPFMGDAHKQLYQQVDKLRASADIARHYSPYSALVQSSCFGKTRSVLEMSTLGVYVCYCSLAGKESTAYPPRTEFLADRLAGSSSELEMVLYLKAWLLLLIHALEQGVSAVEWKEKQLPGFPDMARKVWEEWEQLIASTPAKNGVNRDQVNAEVIEDTLQRVEQLLIVNSEMGVGSGSYSDSDSDSEESDSGGGVIFVFDEARGLILPLDVPFAQLCRALRVFFQRPACFALMLDTSAKVSNLLPKKSNEDSYRALRIGISLLPPIYYLPTLQLNTPKPGLRLNEYTSPSTWLKYGRPVWAARMAGVGSERARTQLLPFAQQKLMGGGHLSVEFVRDGKMSESQAMALLAAATGLQVCPRSPLAEKLAASHMNVLLRVTQDRSRVFVALPAEPILSEAAGGLLRDNNAKLSALMHMEEACMAGYATGGPRGEFSAKFILVAAVWDLVGVGDWCLRPIHVRDYFRKLLVNTRADSQTKNAFRRVASRLPAGGVIFFNSFVVVGKAPDAAMLSRCFAGGHAIMYQADNNMPGSDIVLPIWTPQGMTCAVLSVKNHCDSGWWEGPSLEALQSEFTRIEVAAGLPMVTVLMSMREPSVACPKAWLLWDDPKSSDKYVQLTCYGIDANYGYLSSEVRGLLKNILVTRPDPLQGADACEAEWVKRILPHQYMQLPDFVVSP